MAGFVRRQWIRDTMLSRTAPDRAPSAQILDALPGPVGGAHLAHGATEPSLHVSPSFLFSFSFLLNNNNSTGQ
jgi:hypothetical protein